MSADFMAESGQNVNDGDPCSTTAGEPSKRPVDPADRVTVLTCETVEHRATKRFVLRPDGSIQKQDYLCGYRFACKQHPVRSPRELFKLLQRKVLLDHRTFLVRGTPRDDLKRTTREDGVVVIDEMIRRAVNPDKRGNAPGLVRRYGRWCMFDCDGFQLPPGLDPVKTPDEAVAYIVGLLPPEFAGLAMIFQWSASVGFAGKGVAKFHIFVLTAEPYDHPQLRDYILAAEGPIRFDPQPCNPAQPNYGTGPICVGVEDPLPATKRMVLIPGTRDRFVLPPTPVVEEKLKKRAAKAGVTVEQLRGLPIGFQAKLAVPGRRRRAAWLQPGTGRGSCELRLRWRGRRRGVQGDGTPSDRRCAEARGAGCRH